MSCSRDSLNLAHSLAATGGEPGMRSRLGRLLPAALVAACLCACSDLAGPEYERPPTPYKGNWSELEGRDVPTGEIIRMDWWTAFEDPYLDGLIDTALSEGVDLRIAFLRLERAGVTLEQQRFPLTPEITGGPRTSYRRAGDGDNTTSVQDSDLFLASVNWELDIWGKVRKGVQAAEANYHATEMEWRAAYLTLVVSVSDLYFQIRQFDGQIAQQRAALAQSEALLEIWTMQYREGIAPETRILSQRAEISSRKQQLLDLTRSRREAELKLATLLGQPAGALSVPPGHLRDSVRLIPEPAALPGDLMSRRPDILAAEYNLLAAHNLLGKARLERLPSLTLTGGASAGSGISSLVSSWNYAFLLDWTSFLDRNRRIAVEQAQADVDILVETYRKSVLAAFEEVEIALLNLDTRRNQLIELSKQVAALEIVNRVQQAQLAEGMVSQLEVFDTERNLLDAQLNALSNYRSLLSDTLVLYKAVGGGWPVEVVAND